MRAECLTNLCGNVIRIQFKPRPSALLRAPAILPLILFLGARQATPSLKVTDRLNLLQFGATPARNNTTWLRERHGVSERFHLDAGQVEGKIADGNEPTAFLLLVFTHLYSSKRRCRANRNWPARRKPTGLSPADAIRRWSG